MESGLLGKKIFFLYPPPVLTEVVDELAKLEFEVYFSRDHVKLRRIIASFPDAIVFVNLDDGLDESGWLSFVKSLRSELPAVGVGIITLNDDAELREQYLMNVQVQCGFVILKIGASKTAEILAKTLEANEARGRRKFVRALCPPGSGQCVVQYEGATLRGEVTDLSSAGMAILFQGGSSPKVGTVLSDISLNIKGQRLSPSGVVVAKRADEGGAAGGVHVVMFDPNSLDAARKDKLKTLVFKLNQQAMDAILDRA
jgi:hypothetical protein